MRNARYTAEFKAEAIKKIAERGHGFFDVFNRPGVSDKNLYPWRKQHRTHIPQCIVALRHFHRQLS